MRKLWKKLVVVAVLLTAAVSLSACESYGQEEKAKNDVYDQVKSSKTIIWGVRNDTRLFGLMDIKKDRLVGFDIDLAKAITKQMLGKDAKAELFQTSSKTKIPVLKNGNVDALMATVTITPDRKKEVSFSKPYFNAGQSLLVPAKSKVKSIKDLNKKGMVVVAVKGTTAVANIRKFAPKARVLEYDDYGQAFTALKAGQGQAMSTDNGILAGIAAENKGYHVVGGTFTHEPYGVAVDKGQTKMVHAINKALDELEKNGTYNRLMHKWFDGIPGFSIKEAER
ncbi:transporter substrate-binding domain-containing protein [Lactobacillus hamsteri]|uniref:Amino acid ABC superfamily ATP binding cassette transporter, binding protein n=1 Tax=Lactobacillus hamsteri DSM 5661 = JCM 6256 TaxID=1423754 RepID=A0A0R1YD69_9LACO|nr:transporter substrate-binding domain-containing protein [Lactobacillus hamsteri]KRM40317.1 amino acid ABC superfamily ATP binding cassette transporter, binding protein [Lactobacillus hamsteri DSM 5661 = JCM 6256]